MSCLQKQRLKCHQSTTPTDYCCWTYSRTRVIKPNKGKNYCESPELRGGEGFGETNPKAECRKYLVYNKLQEISIWPGPRTNPKRAHTEPNKIWVRRQVELR